MSVVGFDDDEAASLVTPPLTTVRVPVEDMGRQGGPTVDDPGAGCRIEPFPRLPDSPSAGIDHAPVERHGTDDVDPARAAQY